MRKLKKVVAIVLAMCLVIGSMGLTSFAETENEDFDVYVLNYSNQDIAGYEEYDAKRLYFSPYRTDIWVTENGKLSNWDYCTASILNMINTSKLAEGGVGAYASIPAYCVDAVTDGVTGYEYRRVNLEDSTYFDDTTAGRLRAIMMNTFPHVTDMNIIEDNVNAWIEAKGLVEKYGKVQELNYYEVISATQSVIWVIVNDGKIDNSGLYEDDPGYTGKKKECVYQDAEDYKKSAYTPNNINALGDFLMDLAPIGPSNTVISDAAIDPETAVNFELQSDGTYTAYITTEVTATIDDSNDSLALYVDGYKESTKQEVANGCNSYDLVVTGLDSAEVDLILKVEGFQSAADVFLFDPLNGRNSSQTMAGYDNSTLPVQAMLTIEADDEENVTRSVSVSVKKAWEADVDYVRPESVKVQLYKNGAADGDAITLTADDNWVYTWHELDSNAEWTVKEIDIPAGYTAVITKDENANNVFTITNTYTSERVDISGTKTWVDVDNQDGIRPDSITINLLADGEKVDSAVVTADEYGNWTYKFDNLYKHKNGKEITYTITEDAVEGYESVVDGYNVINTHDTATVDISGSKTWEDKDNQDGIRPEAITINLLADGVKIDSKVVTAEDNWTYEFTGLDKYKDGKEVVYTITEDAVVGYTATINGYDVTNTLGNLPEDENIIDEDDDKEMVPDENVIDEDDDKEMVPDENIIEEPEEPKQELPEDENIIDEEKSPNTGDQSNLIILLSVLFTGLVSVFSLKRKSHR